MPFISCKFIAASDLVPILASFHRFLGHPWKEFSSIVIMESCIDDLVDPTRWLEFNSTVRLNMLFYEEYLNRGPSSITSG